MGANFRNTIILFILSFLLFLWGNNLVSLTNPDEVFYAQTAKEMVQHKTWLVPYLFNYPQFEKPIFIYWLLRLGFILFGVNNFAVRFFPAIFAVLGVIAVYAFCLKAFKEGKKAFICAFFLLSSAFYMGLAKTVFTDMIFSVFILLSLTAFFSGYLDRSKKTVGVILFFVFSALAVLTKGPLGFLIPFSVIFLFLLLKKEIKFLFCRGAGGGVLIFLILALPWYVFMVNKFGSDFIHEFFYNVHIRRVFEAEHPANDTWYFYPLWTIFCMFPWSIFVTASFFSLFRKLRSGNIPAIYLFLSCWIMVVLFVFQVAHSKLISYIFPLFPALAILAGNFLCEMIVSHRRSTIAFFYIFWGLLFIVPIGLTLAYARYPRYSQSVVVYFSVALCMVILAFMLFFIIKHRLFASIYLAGSIMPMFLFFALFSHSSFDSYVSSKEACSYLLDSHRLNNTILCSRFFARGVRYYTDRDVAVIDINGRGFFSPHPLAYLNSDTKTRVFLLSQKTTYCVLNKSGLVDIERISRQAGFKLDLLKIAGDEYVVRISPG
jgi:4-amino-4-deoxy-L-arabinose transferase-like glycosyltransferase